MSLPAFVDSWQHPPEKTDYHHIAPEHQPLNPDEEDHSPADDIAALRHALHRLKLWLIAVSVLFGLALLMLAGARYGHKYFPNRLRWHRSPVPEIPMTSKTFNQDERFAQPASPTSDHAWHSLMPPGMGFVTVQNPRQYKHLKPGLETRNKNEEVYGASLFHQLHCLMNIRKHLWGLETAAKSHNTSALETLYANQDHMTHCLDFVRQALMCAGDMTLEWPDFVKDDVGNAVRVDGQNIPHQCRSWVSCLVWFGAGFVALLMGFV